MGEGPGAAAVALEAGSRDLPCHQPAVLPRTSHLTSLGGWFPICQTVGWERCSLNSPPLIVSCCPRGGGRGRGGVPLHPYSEANI